MKCSLFVWTYSLFEVVERKVRNCTEAPLLTQRGKEKEDGAMMSRITERTRVRRNESW